MEWLARDRCRLAYPLGDPLARPGYALVGAYQSRPGARIEHGAVATLSLPQTVGVDDASQCDLPQDSDLWPLLALSCFEHEGQPVPILSTAQLFGGYHG